MASRRDLLAQDWDNPLCLMTISVELAFPLWEAAFPLWELEFPFWEAAFPFQEEFPLWEVLLFLEEPLLQAVFQALVQQYQEGRPINDVRLNHVLSILVLNKPYQHFSIFLIFSFPGYFFSDIRLTINSLFLWFFFYKLNQYVGTYLRNPQKILNRKFLKSRAMYTIYLYFRV